jgi:hypothetical protein
VLRFLLLALAFVGSALCFDRLSVPFAGIFGIWAAFFAIVAIQGSRSRRDAVWFNLGFAFLTLALFEVYLWKGLEKYGRIDYAAGYHIQDDVLGFAPRKGQVADTRKFHGDRLLYDVTYTIDEHGLRIAPPHEEGGRSRCILFFGGSFAFGEGVNDDQTTPYLTGLKTAATLRTYNFAFHAYGPHQMLAALEQGRVEAVIDCEPEYAFYIAIFDHVSRAVGLRSWGREGPRFVLDGDAVVHRGRFDESVLPAAVTARIDQSLIAQNIRERPHAVGPEEIAVYAAVVAASRDRFESHYPGSEFHVLQVGDVHSEMAVETWKAVEARGIRVHRREKILPDAGREPMKYVLSEFDSHPNPLAHSRIADYVVDLVR